MLPYFLACNCNGYSERCFFDKELYKITGHGGHCLDCRANRDGPNCERCRENYYQHPEDDYCVACNCNEIGKLIYFSLSSISVFLLLFVNWFEIYLKEAIEILRIISMFYLYYNL